MKRMRFGVNITDADTADTADTWTDTCRAVEERGYDLLLAPDHLDSGGPFTLLAATAAVTDRLRLGTYVLNNEFWNTALLAREAATLDRISGGRFELGLGAGHMKWELEDAGIPWRAHGERLADLAAAVDGLERRLGEGRPPLLIGGHGPTTLALAAERADTVAVAGLTQRKGERMGVFRVGGAAETDERVALVRERAAGRDVELSVLLQRVEITDDVERSAAALLDLAGPGVLPGGEPVWENPYLLMGTVEEMADALIRRRDRYGFTHVVALAGRGDDALAEVIPLVRAREGAQGP